MFATGFLAFSHKRVAILFMTFSKISGIFGSLVQGKFTQTQKYNFLKSLKSPMSASINDSIKRVNTFGPNIPQCQIVIL